MQAPTRAMTFADTLLPRTTIWRDAGLVVLFSLLNALAAQVRIELPFTPVPITGQTFAVLLTGMLLGSRLGALTLLAYLAEGVAGIPVFNGLKAGPLHVLGPTGGYLVGFVVAAYCVGLLAERGWDRRFWTTALAMLVGNVVIYVAGIGWLSRFVGPEQAVTMGIVPFIPGDIAKLVLAAVILPQGWRLLGGQGRLR